MDYGFGAYLMFVAAMAVVLHLLSRRLLVVSFVGAVLCSVLQLYYGAWVVNFRVNVAWAPAVLVVGFAEALTGLSGRRAPISQGASLTPLVDPQNRQE